MVLQATFVLSSAGSAGYASSFLQLRLSIALTAQGEPLGLVATPRAAAVSVFGSASICSINEGAALPQRIEQGHDHTLSTGPSERGSPGYGIRPAPLHATPSTACADGTTQRTPCSPVGRGFPRVVVLVRRQGVIPVTAAALPETPGGERPTTTLRATAGSTAPVPTPYGTLLAAAQRTPDEIPHGRQSSPASISCRGNEYPADHRLAH